MKKIIIIISGILFFFLVILFIKRLYGKSGYKEGEDVAIIEKRFPALIKIRKCFYKIDIISVGGVGPTRYRISSLCMIDDINITDLPVQYEWEEMVLEIDSDFYNRMGITDGVKWYHSGEFKKKVLGGRFVGEVYMSHDGKYIYIQAEE